MPLAANFDVDVFIAGGGPAGLAAAIAAAQQGFSVELADGMPPAIDKACGEGLLPDALRSLAQLGITLPSGAGADFHGIRFLEASLSAEARFPDGPGRGVRRPVLHQLLCDRAAALGVSCRWRTSVRSISGHDIETSRHRLRARWIIGADGHQSRIRTWAGLDRATISSRRLALRDHFAVTPWSDVVEVYWSDLGQAYVTPVSSNEICLAFVGHSRYHSLAQALDSFPELKASLAGTTPSGSPRGGVSFARHLHRVASGHFALIGDASGSVDAITGEGLSLCFRQALALPAALHAEDLSLYETAHRRIHLLPRIMSRSLLLMDGSPLIRRATLRTFTACPALFSSLLRVHTRRPALPLDSSTNWAAGAQVLAR